MNYSAVVRILAFLMLLLAAAGTVAGLVAAFSAEQAQVFAFAAMVVGIAVPASSILLLTHKPKRRSRPSDALAVAILWWFAAPVATALPFVVGIDNTSLLSAVHEATACLTTTGQSVIAVEDNIWPGSLVFWRGALHLIGGIASIVMAASVLAALNLGGPGIHRTVLFTVPETSFFDAVPRVIRSVALMIAICLFFLSFALVFSGVPWARAVSDATSALTTGLVHPETELRAPLSALSNTLLAAGLIFGALGLAIWLPLREGRVVAAVSDPETLLFGGLVLLFALFVLPLGAAFGDALAWSLTVMSTSGLAISNTSLSETMPLSIFVLPGLIGGSALSAAGGVKLARLIVLGRRAEQEFRQLGFRKSVLGFRFRGRELDERSVIGVWVYLIAYVLSVFLVMIGFSFMGVPFQGTILLSVGSLTNSGALLVGHTGDINSGTEALLIFAMLLGRLEILALLPALSISFWRG